MPGKDQYMNFFNIESASAASSATLVADDNNTGSGMATNLAWRIHKIELTTDMTWNGGADGNRLIFAVSTRKAASAMPTLSDKGTIAVFQKTFNLFGAGTGHTQATDPLVADYLPPLIIASPNLSLYFQSNANFAGAQAKTINCRIGFTTEKLSEGLYREVFETWNYAN